jgi:hypothetical protein
MFKTFKNESLIVNETVTDGSPVVKVVSSPARAHVVKGFDVPSNNKGENKGFEICWFTRTQ